VVAPKLSLPQPTPVWWEKGFEAEINRSVSFVHGASILDGSLLRRIAEGYRTCPWVREVVSVRKRFPDEIEASIRIRWPVAAVKVRTRRGLAYALLGGDGVRLPKTYGHWPQPELDVPFIEGVSCPAPEPGGRWAEKSVQDAVRIVALLNGSDVIRRTVRITAVDVSNYGGRGNPTRSEFLLRAEGNCVIAWGRSPDTETPGELPVEEKIAKLERFLARGDPIRNRELGLRFAGPVVVRRRTGTHGDSS